jgi:hypothetical protein
MPQRTANRRAAQCRLRTNGTIKSTNKHSGRTQEQDKYRQPRGTPDKLFGTFEISVKTIHVSPLTRIYKNASQKKAALP